MTASRERTKSTRWNAWRVARWAAALALLLTPLAMMRISEDWNWGAGSFLLAGVMIGGVGLLYELAERASESRAYRAGAAVALLASFLTVWATFVRDDGDGVAFLLLVLAAAVSAFSAWLQPAGMARAMLGVAAMQGLLGLAMATAPSAARSAEGPARIALFNAFFAAMWLISAAFFLIAAKRERRAGAAP